MYTIYVLQNSDGKLYIGQTSDLNRRIQEHNITGTGYTSKYRPWRLLWSKDFSIREEVVQQEKYLKTGAGRDWLKKNVLRA